MKYTKLAIGLAAMALLSACGDPIADVVKQNIEGIQNQDLAMVMETIDQNSQAYEATEKATRRLLEEFNVDVQIVSMDIIEQPRDEAKAMEKAQQENEDLTGLNAELESFITEQEKEDAEAKAAADAAAMAKRPLIAKVKVVQETRQKDGNANTYMDNRLQVIHTLHKYPNDAEPTWKIYKSDVTSMKPLQADEG